MALFGKKKKVDENTAQTAENTQSNSVTDEMKVILEAREEEQQEKEKQQMLRTIGQLTLERDFIQDAFRRCGLPVPQFNPKDE